LSPLHEQLETKSDIKEETKESNDVKDVKDLANKNEKKPASLLEIFYNDIYACKFVEYKKITKGFELIGGELAKTRGSHETWIFPNYNKVKFGFYKLHGKDQYGPWTKKYILNFLEELVWQQKN